MTILTLLQQQATTKEQKKQNKHGDQFFDYIPKCQEIAAQHMTETEVKNNMLSPSLYLRAQTENRVNRYMKNFCKFRRLAFLQNWVKPIRKTIRFLVHTFPPDVFSHENFYQKPVLQPLLLGHVCLWQWLARVHGQQCSLAADVSSSLPWHTHPNQSEAILAGNQELN